MCHELTLYRFMPLINTLSTATKAIFQMLNITVQALSAQRGTSVPARDATVLATGVPLEKDLG